MATPICECLANQVIVADQSISIPLRPGVAYQRWKQAMLSFLLIRSWQLWKLISHLPHCYPTSESEPIEIAQALIGSSWKNFVQSEIQYDSPTLQDFSSDFSRQNYH